MPENSRDKLSIIISRLQAAGELNAEGYYSVNKNLLVCLTGTFLTYVIILIQMNA